MTSLCHAGVARDGASLAVVPHRRASPQSVRLRLGGCYEGGRSGARAARHCYRTFKTNTCAFDTIIYTISR